MIMILYEDRNIVVVDKPIGLASIPERDRSIDCVLARMERQLRRKLLIVHRLDKDASGILIYAKNAESHQYMNRLFADRLIEKTYAAIVHGIVAEDEGTIEAPIRLFGSGRMGIDAVRGKASCTNFLVVKRFAAHTLIDAFPITGRRHQIRVHCYSRGHPIAGDPLYGDKNLQQNYPRLLLHAKRIVFTGMTGKHITIDSRLPGEFLTIEATETPAPPQASSLPALA
jgi:RluA family pseudouridine synthase